MCVCLGLLEVKAQKFTCDYGDCILLLCMGSLNTQCVYNKTGKKNLISSTSQFVIKRDATK